MTRTPTTTSTCSGRRRASGTAYVRPTTFAVPQGRGVWQTFHANCHNAGSRRQRPAGPQDIDAHARWLGQTTVRTKREAMLANNAGRLSIPTPEVKEQLHHCVMGYTDVANLDVALGRSPRDSHQRPPPHAPTQAPLMLHILDALPGRPQPSRRLRERFRDAGQHSPAQGRLRARGGDQTGKSHCPLHDIVDMDTLQEPLQGDEDVPTHHPVTDFVVLALARHMAARRALRHPRPGARHTQRLPLVASTAPRTLGDISGHVLWNHALVPPRHVFWRGGIGVEL